MSAAIFDIDGTLIESVDFHGKAWQENGDLSRSCRHPRALPGIRGVAIAYARPANSRVSECTLIFSPSLMNSGT